ncbi:MAG: cytochrome c oxidase subunit 3 [Rhodobacteraceae bacterium]|nr:cytochrome c oxidase subunit 3 [Paracoccaceae bacterium]
MAHEKNHDYHILEPSPWPLMGALSAFILFLGSVMYMNTGWPWVMIVGLLGVLYTMYVWWADVIRESQTGDHTPVVKIGLRYGVIMFIASEVMFFVAWFWIFFKSALYPMDQIDGIILTATQWPPVGIETFDPWHLPLINTLILLCSGAAATWAHHAIAHENNRKDLQTGLLIAVVLGVFFTILQVYEYSHASFAFSGNIYGGVFFMATGFHGFHVIIGTIFLAVCYFRARAGHFTKESHVGLEAAAWYWHFVDVVWLFLFISIYVWAA